MKQRLLVPLLVVLVATGCAGEREQGPASPSAVVHRPAELGGSPPGRVEANRYTFAYPTAWKVARDPSVSGLDVQISESGQPTAPTATIAAASDEGFRESFEAMLNLFELGPMSGLPDRQVLERRPVRVPGASEARLLDQRFTQPVRDGLVISQDNARRGDRRLRFRQWNLLALGPRGVTVNVALGVAERDFKASRPAFERIVRSLALKP
jgi:hypothetical protein